MNVVVDTNVLAVANDHAPHASLDCVKNCILFLLKIQTTPARVSVDDGGRIFEEYGNYANHAGQPGVGDAFFKWLFQNQGLAETCELVKICPHPQRGFEEFPDDPALENFDPSDRKFVAVARASSFQPTIFNAVDSDWHTHRAVFERLDISISQLCE